MKRLRICCCLLLLGMLLAIAGCKGNKGARYAYKGTAVQQDYVTIYNCAATPDLVIVPNHGKIHWTVTSSDTATYTVVFTTDNLIRDPLPVVSHHSPDTIHTVSNKCSTTNMGPCDKFPYTLIQTSTDRTVEACPDPGVQVIPN
jgi:hypothetical protein